MNDTKSVTETLFSSGESGNGGVGVIIKDGKIEEVVLSWFEATYFAGGHGGGWVERLWKKGCSFVMGTGYRGTSDDRLKKLAALGEAITEMLGKLEDRGLYERT